MDSPGVGVYEPTSAEKLTTKKNPSGIIGKEERFRGKPTSDLDVIKSRPVSYISNMKGPTIKRCSSMVLQDSNL
jgi:hypothetical protein